MWQNICNPHTSGQRTDAFLTAQHECAYILTTVGGHTSPWKAGCKWSCHWLDQTQRLYSTTLQDQLYCTLQTVKLFVKLENDPSSRQTPVILALVHNENYNIRTQISDVNIIFIRYHLRFSTYSKREFEWDTIRSSENPRHGRQNFWILHNVNERTITSN